jgi:hypothetical protein
MKHNNIRFFCEGKHSDGSEVVAEITDFSTFINASPDELIVVECEVKKGDVDWQRKLLQQCNQASE